MADYKLNFGGGVTRTNDGAAIPADPNNRDYREYLEWLDSGGVPDPIPEPAPETAPGDEAARASAAAKVAEATGLTTDEAAALFGRPLTSLVSVEGVSTMADPAATGSIE